MISHAIKKTTGEATAAKVGDRAATMRRRAHAFCQALVDPPAARELIAEYMVPEPASASAPMGPRPTVHEHGPAWANGALPFLGRDFAGAQACEAYFAALVATLRMELDAATSFPGPGGFAVDATGGGRVAVAGRGTFASVATGRSWDERFAYVLSGWDEAGRRFARWDVWADPLSAWAAVGEPDMDGWKKGEHRP